MAKFSLFIKPSAVREIESLQNKKDRQRILDRIGLLADDPFPSGCKKLSGYDRYRIRQGNFRILYEVNGGELTVVVVKVGDRKEIYR